ncbi:MAG: DUF1858 domain-containing protein [Ignavibacteriaceae bacterium]|nr:DUF1858 domain-containing protein [Ignavibacteriaceae bacterium]
MEKNKLLITPKTKVLELIEAYPALEEVLINYVPAFEKLKNPVLRRTVAKIATLQQAAAVGGVDVGELINTLRKAIGQKLIMNTTQSDYKASKPSWFNAENVKQELDVREMLSRGEHPVNQVIADLRALPEGAIYKLTAPFLPAPLIDKATSLKFDHWVEKENEALYRVYFIKSSD